MANYLPIDGNQAKVKVYYFPIDLDKVHVNAYYLPIHGCQCCKQYWTCPGSNTPHGDKCTATYHLSWKLYKLDEPDMPDTAGEAKTRS